MFNTKQAEQRTYRTQQLGSKPSAWCAPDRLWPPWRSCRSWPARTQAHSISQTADSVAAQHASSATGKGGGNAARNAVKHQLPLHLAFSSARVAASGLFL